MLDLICPASIFVLGKLRREKRPMSNIQCEWVFWEELLGAIYSDEHTQCGNLMEVGRDAARECMMGGRGRV